MQPRNKVMFNLIAAITIAGSLALVGCGGGGDDRVPASAATVSGKAYTFTDGAAIDSRLAGKTTTVAFNSNATRVSITSAASRATGSVVFGSCIFQIGNTTNPDAPVSSTNTVGGGSNFAPGTGPGPNQQIVLTTCDVDTTNDTLNVVNSNGTAGGSGSGTPTGSSGFGG